MDLTEENEKLKTLLTELIDALEACRHMVKDTQRYDRDMKLLNRARDLLRRLT